MRAKDFILSEAYINIHSDQIIDRLNYANEIYAMLVNAYESIGGLKGYGLDSVDAMIGNIPFWKIAKREDRILAVMLYRDKLGRKRVAMASDGTPEGKHELALMLIDEYRTMRSYAEISGLSLRFHYKLLGDELDTISIPAEDALCKLNDPESRPTGDPYEYERLINGEWIAKRMVGNPNAVFNSCK